MRRPCSIDEDRHEYGPSGSVDAEHTNSRIPVVDDEQIFAALVQGEVACRRTPGVCVAKLAQMASFVAVCKGDNPAVVRDTSVQV